MKVSRQLLIGVVAAMAVTVALVVWWVNRPTPERAIRTVLTGLGAAAVAEDIDAFGAFISPDWRGEVFNDRALLLSEVDQAFDDVADLAVSFPVIEPLIVSDFARVMVLVDVSGVVTSSGLYNRVPFRGVRGGSSPEPWYFELRQNNQGQWLIEYVTWEVDDLLGDFPDVSARMPR